MIGVDLSPPAAQESRYERPGTRRERAEVEHSFRPLRRAETPLEDFWARYREFNAPSIPRFRATLAGTVREFRSVSEKFNALADEWNDYNLGRSIIQYAHPAYWQVIGMGDLALPFLLKSVARGEGTWYPALEAITGVRATADGDRGDAAAVRRAWLEWGRLNGYGDACHA